MFIFGIATIPLRRSSYFLPSAHPINTQPPSTNPNPAKSTTKHPQTNAQNCCWPNALVWCGWRGAAKRKQVPNSKSYASAALGICALLHVQAAATQVCCSSSSWRWFRACLLLIACSTTKLPAHPLSATVPWLPEAAVRVWAYLSIEGSYVAILIRTINDPPDPGSQNHTTCASSPRIPLERSSLFCFPVLSTNKVTYLLWIVCLKTNKLWYNSIIKW